MRLNQEKLDQAIDLYKFEIDEGSNLLEAHIKVHQDFNFNYFEYLMFRSIAYDYILEKEKDHSAKWPYEKHSR